MLEKAGDDKKEETVAEKEIVDGQAEAADPAGQVEAKISLKFNIRAHFA